MKGDERDDYIRLLREENARMRAAIESGLEHEKTALEAERLSYESAREAHRQEAIDALLGRHDFAVIGLRRAMRFLAALPHEAGAADLLNDYGYITRSVCRACLDGFPMTYHQRFASTLCAAFDDARALGGTITALVRWNAAVRYIVMVG